MSMYANSEQRTTTEFWKGENNGELQLRQVPFMKFSTWIHSRFLL